MVGRCWGEDDKKKIYIYTMNGRKMIENVKLAGKQATAVYVKTILMTAKTERTRQREK